MEANYSDSDLVEMFRDVATREKSFNYILDRYKKRLYWHIRKIVIDHDDTDDLLQNTLIKAWEALPQFRNESLLFTWLYRIATNESITFLNKKRKRFFLPIVNVESQLTDKLEASPYFNGDQLQLAFQKAILSLPEKQRLVFNMKYFEELKYEEMSEILGTSVGALKASYHHAVKKIEKMINNE